jgi:hypothetical protein
MITAVSRAHAASYERDGAVRIEGLFSDWVGPLTEAVTGVIAGARAGAAPPADPRYRHLNALRLVEPFGGGAMALNIVPHHATFTRWLEESPAAEAAATVMDSRTSRFWIDASFLKDEDGASDGTPWHNDTCTWPFWGRQMTILWIALTDIGDDDGPLLTVSGSHGGDGRYYSPFFPPTDALPPPYKPWEELLAKAEAPDADIRAWTMRAGDCLLMHPSTVHGSRPRRSGGGPARLAFSTRWLGDDAVFRPDPLTEPMTEKLNRHPAMRYGAPPPESLMPLGWPRAG